MVKFFGNDFNIFWLIEALFVAILLSCFIYLEWLGFTYPLLNTFLGLAGLYMLLQSNARVWTWSGFLIALFWFWWIALSFRYYGFAWAIPLGVITVTLIYGTIFWLFIKLAYYIKRKFTTPTLYTKALFIFAFSYLHPFGFDWLKFELVLVDSYFGVAKWQFGLVLVALILAISYRNNKFLWLSMGTHKGHPYIIMVLLLLALDFSHPIAKVNDKKMKLITTNINIDDKWNPELHTQHLHGVYTHIEEAIEHNYSTVILPESVIPSFINKYEQIKEPLKHYSNDINIVMGGLYLDDDGTPRNSTYIFSKDRMQIANKVVLVPFGEANPLPDFLSDWVNKIFYDGAVDYKASSRVSDYILDEKVYRNAICFEATSERLYIDSPKYIIAISNNGWFTPSIEPTLQKLLLKYYSRKYGTTIYHSINASPSYIISTTK